MDAALAAELAEDAVQLAVQQFSWLRRLQQAWLDIRFPEEHGLVANFMRRKRVFQLVRSEVEQILKNAAL